MKSIVLLFINLIISVVAFAQPAGQDSLSKRKIEYYFQIQSGSLIGCNSCSDGKQISFSGSTTHGVKIGKKLRVAGGVGFDSYFEWNTMPMFGSVSWDVIGKKNVLYLEMNYGAALASWKPLDFQENGYQKTNSGRMFSYGVGYRIKYDKMRISIGLGHKTQRLTSYYEYETYYWNNIAYVLGDPNRKTVKNEINRLQVWLAVGWK